MPIKYLNKYRTTSFRVQSWDYENNGSYFITICTNEREHFFGDIVNHEMQLNWKVGRKILERDSKPIFIY